MDIRNISPGASVKKFLKENPSPVTGDLICYLDAGNPESYPGSGTTWYDLSGNNNHGTIVGSPSYSSEGGGSFLFGSGKYVSLPAGVPGSIVDGFAIEAWVKPTSTPVSNNAIFFSDSSSNAGYTGITLNSTSGFGINVNGTLNYHNLSISMNSWYNVVGVRELGSARGTPYYHARTMVNATAPLVSSNSPATISSNSPIIAGQQGDSSSYFSGYISVIRIYQDQLKSGQVWYNFRSERDRFGII